MNDKEKIQMLIDMDIASQKAAQSNFNRNKTAFKRLTSVQNRVATALLGRRPTDSELEAMRQGYFSETTLPVQS